METRRYTIEYVNFRGDGIARSQQPGRRTVCIGNALAGEIVLATEIPSDGGEGEEKRRYSKRPGAYLREVLMPSPLRVAPVCPQWQRCAMCQYACMAYDAQAAIKREQWIRLLSKFVGIEKIPNNIRFKKANYATGYRNRCEGFVLGGVIGVMPRAEAYAAEISETGASAPIDLSSCAMHDPALNRLIARVNACAADCGFAQETRLSFEANGDARDLPFDGETAAATSRIIVYAMPDEADRTRAAARRLCDALSPIGTSVVLQVLPPRGSHVYPAAECIGHTAWYAYDIDGAGGNVLCALKGAWTPVNPRHAHMIRETLSELSADSAFEHVCEIGCGCGTHTGVFAPKSQRYTGIDASWPAILSAQFNAKHDAGWGNASFFADTAEHYLDKRYYKGVRADAIVLHSNRLPYGERVAAMCRRFGAETVFIVGPTAYALSRECRQFADLGYRITDIVLCDTLPMSYHMMGVARLAIG